MELKYFLSLTISALLFTYLFIICYKIVPTETKYLEQTKHRSCKSSWERCWAKEGRGADTGYIKVTLRLCKEGMLSRICFPVFRKAHKASYTCFGPGVLIRPTSKTSTDLMLFASNVQTGSQHSHALGLPSCYHSSLSLSGFWKSSSELKARAAIH